MHQRSAQWWTGNALEHDPDVVQHHACEPGRGDRQRSVLDAAQCRALLLLRRPRPTPPATRTPRPRTPRAAQLAAPDTTAANGTLDRPTANQVLPLGQLTFAGKATDDTGVGWVDISVQNRDTGLWWNDVTHGWGPFTWNNGESTAATRWASPTSWSYTYTPPTAGNYRLGARARDNDGRVDATPAWVNFSVS